MYSCAEYGHGNTGCPSFDQSHKPEESLAAKYRINGKRSSFSFVISIAFVCFYTDVPLAFLQRSNRDTAQAVSPPHNVRGVFPRKHATHISIAALRKEKRKMDREK